MKTSTEIPTPATLHRPRRIPCIPHAGVPSASLLAYSSFSSSTPSPSSYVVEHARETAAEGAVPALHDAKTEATTAETLDRAAVMSWLMRRLRGPPRHRGRSDRRSPLQACVDRRWCCSAGHGGYNSGTLLPRVHLHEEAPPQQASDLVVSSDEFARDKFIQQEEWMGSRSSSHAQREAGRDCGCDVPQDRTEAARPLYDNWFGMHYVFGHFVAV